MPEGVTPTPPVEVQTPVAPPSAEGAGIQASMEAPTIADTLKGVENGTTDVSAEAHQLADQLRNETSADAGLHDLANTNSGDATQDRGQQIDAILDNADLSKDERDEKLKALSQEKNDTTADQSAENQTPSTDTFEASVTDTNTRLDEMRQKSPDELKTLAESGNILAKRILSEQQAPPAPTSPEASSNPPLSETTGAEVVAEAEAATQAAVEVPTESGETTDSTEATAEEEGLSPEQQARLDGMNIGAELAKRNVDPNSAEGKALMKDLAENPEGLDTAIKALDAAKAYHEAFGTEASQQSTEATQTALEQQLADAEAKGDKEGADKIKSLLIILAVIIASLAAAAIVVPGAVAVAAPMAAIGGTAALMKKA